MSDPKNKANYSGKVRPINFNDDVVDSAIEGGA
jgi:hypothetical protein